MLDKIKGAIPTGGDGDDDLQDQAQDYGPAPCRETVLKNLKIGRRVLDEVEDILLDTKIAVDDREEIIEQHEKILELGVEITGNQYEIKYYPADQNPTLDQIAEVIADVNALLEYDYVIDERVVSCVERLRQESEQLINLIESKPEFPYAYNETGRRTEYNHEVQSFGVPEEINPDELDPGEDGEEVYAAGRALKAMEDVCQDPSSPLWLGVGTRNGRDVSIEKNVLFRHRAIFGQTGYGKSTLITNDAKQLIESGAGLCFIDPKGDDSKRLMQIIPEDRMDDVVWIEPSAHGSHLSGFNYITIGMDRDNPNYEVARANLVSDLKKMLKMSADYWGPRMDRVAANLITAMNMYNDRTPDDAPEMNLVDLYYILKSEASRKEFAARCRKAGLRFVDDYTEEIAEMSDDDLEPLLGRFLPWIQNPVPRRMIGFREGGVNIPKAIENDRIIIVRMGSEPRELKQMLGMAVIRRIWSRIRSRANQAHHSRKPFYLFVDEFDNIALRDETIPSIISESRSYRLSLNVANQYPHQLPDNVVDAITTNCDTIISFNPGDRKAARTYNTQLGLDPEVLTEEVNYHVWLRTTLDAKMEKSDAFRAYVYPPHPPKRNTQQAQDGINASLRKFGRERRSDEQTYRNLLFNGGSGKWETGIGEEIVMADDDDLKRDLEIMLDEQVPEPDDPFPAGKGDGSGSAGGDVPAAFGGGASSSSGSGSSPASGHSSDPVEAHLDTILESIFATAVQTGREATGSVTNEQVKERLKDRLPDDVGVSYSECPTFSRN